MSEAELRQWFRRFAEILEQEGLTALAQEARAYASRQRSWGVSSGADSYIEGALQIGLDGGLSFRRERQHLGNLKSDALRAASARMRVRREMVRRLAKERPDLARRIYGETARAV